jgi:hypothetical protein
MPWSPPGPPAPVAGRGLVVLRADSAFLGLDVIAAARRGGARFSATARLLVRRVRRLNPTGAPSTKVDKDGPARPGTSAVDPGVRPAVRAPRTERSRRCNRTSSSGQPAGESPVRRDARVPGSGAPGVDREVGVEVEHPAPSGGAQLAGPQHEAKPAASSAPPAARRGKEEPSPCLRG